MRNADRVNRLHILYYAAALLFVVLDFAFGVNVRATFLEQHDVARAFYYLLLFVCLVLVLRFPEIAAYVGTLESGITLGALIVSFAARVLVPTDVMVDASRGVVTIAEVVNFLIVGFYAYFVYMSGIKQINNPKSR